MKISKKKETLDILGISKKDKFTNVESEEDKNSEIASSYTDEILWNQKNGENSASEEINEKESIILKKPKITSLLPSGRKEDTDTDTPNKLGVFSTKLGTVEVGYKKYSENGKLSFSLISDSDKKEDNIKEKSPYKHHVYFGGNYSHDEKKFKTSSLSFEYDPKTKAIKKSGAMGNTNEDELIYSNDMEDEKLDDLKDAKENVKNKEAINKHINFNEKVKNVKEDENQEFLAEIKKFIKRLEQGKVNLVADSDDVIQMKKRILELQNKSNVIELIELILYKLAQKKFNKEVLEYFKKMNFKDLSIEQLKSILQKLQNYIEIR